MLKKIATTLKKDVENNIICNIMMYFHKCGAYGRYNASDKYLFYFNVFSEVRCICSKIQVFFFYMVLFLIYLFKSS